MWKGYHDVVVAVELNSFPGWLRDQLSHEFYIEMYSLLVGKNADNASICNERWLRKQFREHMSFVQ